MGRKTIACKANHEINPNKRAQAITRYGGLSLTRTVGTRKNRNPSHTKTRRHEGNITDLKIESTLCALWFRVKK